MATKPVDNATVIAKHPAFRLRCICATSAHRVRLTPPDGEERAERVCTVCTAQLEALGYRVEMIG
jgi:hypothetical protein